MITAYEGYLSGGWEATMRDGNVSGCGGHVHSTRENGHSLVVLLTVNFYLIYHADFDPNVCEYQRDALQPITLLLIMLWTAPH
jgi:hypothetical protein